MNDFFFFFFFFFTSRSPQGHHLQYEPIVATDSAALGELKLEETLFKFQPVNFNLNARQT